jgi:hypothetical protein
MNGSHKWVVIFGLVAFVLASCSKKTGVSGYEKLPRIKTNELAEKLDSLSQSDWVFLSTKINTKFSSREQKQSFKTSLKMRRDSLINATITFASIPIINAVISPDTLKVVNKKDKCFIIEDVNFLKKKFDLPFEFSQLEELLLGLPLAWDKNAKYHQLDDLNYYVLSSHKKRFLGRRDNKQENDIMIRYFLTPHTFELAQVLVDSPEDTTSVRIQYFDRYSDAGFPLPQRTEILIFTPRDTIAVELKFLKPELEKEKSIFLTIPENYEKCN